MIGANRDVDRDWAEFEIYATDHYAQTLVRNQTSLPTRISPNKSTVEYQQSSIDPASNQPLEIKSITDEMASVRKTLSELRTQSVEVSVNVNQQKNVNFDIQMNRCMQWMMDAMDRVKMSKDPKPIAKFESDTSNCREEFDVVHLCFLDVKDTS